MRNIKVGTWIVFIGLSLMFLGNFAVTKYYSPNVKEVRFVHDTIVVHDTVRFAK